VMITALVAVATVVAHDASLCTITQHL
jgi:hypothetical protein